ncbi:MAG TPA: secondary thiamine-phosphate synthase enzyme YjbQ [Oligoflexia bacterium]|nr:secondary thiamine-phosphate synthase enzyme YjbQ [Oligoflexia bacterium]HMP49011.1 secondary thiamine-phosphate synthase enzyme YjbQ [Oligoflexia bacterium]
MPTITVSTHGQGLYEVTHLVESILDDYCNSHNSNFDGLLTVFIQHTSASLVIQENADPTAKHDLENWLSRFVPENDPNFTHTHEGPDDMPSHIKAALTQTSIGIPIIEGRLALGTWQGIYLWEHRKMAHRRKLAINILGQ